MNNPYASDIESIIAHRYDNGGDCWATADKKLLKGSPFTTLESAMYLLTLGVPPEDEILRHTAALIFSCWKDDGRIKTAPTGGIYPCHTALAVNVLCHMGYASDARVRTSFDYFIKTQQPDGGWKCNKYSFGRGEETAYSTPYTTLTVLDLFRFSGLTNNSPALDRAVDFLLEHWVIRKPISPCHYGIGSLFMQVEFPFRGYNLFYYLYVLSFYDCAKKDPRFLQALKMLEQKAAGGQIIVERAVPKLAALSFCKKGQPSPLATEYYQTIMNNVEGRGDGRGFTPAP